MRFKLGLYSKYRTELMGVAALLIILCHTVPFRVQMPKWIATILQNGGIGVDIFLFLSAMGMYNSWLTHRRKNGTVFSWYWKRYVRIIVPMFLITMPLTLWNPWGNEQHLWEILIDATGFGAMFGTSGLWFITSILYLYIATPLLHNLLTGRYRWIWLITLCVIGLSSKHCNCIHPFLQFCCPRWVSYFIGYTLAKEIKERGKYGNILLFVIVPLSIYTILYICNHTIYTDFSLFWLQGIPVLTVCAIFIERIQNLRLNTALAFMGKISLESYVTNEYILGALTTFSWIIWGIDFAFYGWGFYLVGTALCIVVSVVVNNLSKEITNKISI